MTDGDFGGDRRRGRAHRIDLDVRHRHLQEAHQRAVGDPRDHGQVIGISGARQIVQPRLQLAGDMQIERSVGHRCSI